MVCKHWPARLQEPVAQREITGESDRASLSQEVPVARACLHKLKPSDSIVTYKQG